MAAKIMVEHSRKEPGSSEYSSRGYRAFIELEVDAATAACPTHDYRCRVIALNRKQEVSPATPLVLTI